MAIHQLTAVQACESLRQGTKSPQQIKQHLLNRVTQLDPKLGAFLYQDHTQAMATSSPLAGLPISFKDQFHIEGSPCSFGLPRTTMSEFTAPVAEELFRQGASLLGKTSLPPFAMDFQTNNKIRGFCNNPWNQEYTSGGSSGGGATAVASGMSFVDIGTDLAGSLRIPASFCGVYSLLPSEGALTNQGIFVKPELSLPHFARPGPIAREPQDLALIWQALTPETRIDLGEQLNLAIWQQAEDLPLDSDISNLINQATTSWQSAGHQCHQTKPEQLSFASCWRTYGKIMGFETSGLMNPFIRWLSILSGKSSRKRSPHFLANVMQGYRRNKNEYRLALKQREGLIQHCQEFFEQYDAWILPVTCSVAFRHMQPSTEHGPNRDYKTPLMINGQELNYLDALTAYTTPVSLIGHPVITMPIGLDSNGLPVGIQLIGKMNGETKLLQIAEELSKYIEMPTCPALLEPAS